MIALWMTYAIGLGLALGVAAVALEQSLRLFDRQARGVWVVALAASLAAPVALALLPQEIPTVVPVSSVVRPGDLPTVVPAAPTLPVPAVPRRSLADLIPLDRIAALDRPLMILWLAASVLTALALLAAHVGLARDLARWPSERLHDRAVRMSPDVGPAVVGAWRGEVVLPAWARELPAGWQALIMQHEAEHVAARDALLLVAAALAVVLCPWNLALWWQRKRLRDAVELDCDTRVLRGGASPAEYGALLVDVARRSAGIPRAAIALAEPPSLLARRVVMLVSPRVRARAAKGALGIAVGGLVVALACEAPHPLGPVAPAPADAVALGSLPSPILQRTVGDIEYPPLLAEAGIGATVVLSFEIRPNGSVDSGSIHPISSTDRRFEQLPLAWLKLARFGARDETFRVQQPFIFAVSDTLPSAARASRSTTPPYPIYVTYLRHGYDGKSAQAAVSSHWVGPATTFAFGHMVGRPAVTPGGFSVSTSEAFGSAPSGGPQDIHVTSVLLESGRLADVQAVFQVHRDGRADPATIVFRGSPPPAVQEAVRQSIIDGDFHSGFDGTSAQTRTAYQTVSFKAKQGPTGLLPNGWTITTFWDHDPAQDSVVLPKRIAMPMVRYPAMLLEAGITGHATLQFAVKPDGSVESSTVRVIDSTRAAFGASAQEALVRARFTPGAVRGKPATITVTQSVYWVIPRADGSYDKPAAASGQLDPIVVLVPPPPPG